MGLYDKEDHHRDVDDDPPRRVSTLQSSGDECADGKDIDARNKGERGPVALQLS